MNTYEYQRSRSLFDLRPRSLSFILSTVFCSKFYLEPLFVRGTIGFSNGPGHVTNMTKMAAIPYIGGGGLVPLKKFFTGTKRPK